MVDATDYEPTPPDTVKETDDAFYEYVKSVATIEDGSLVIGEWVYDLGSLLEDVDPAAFQTMRIAFDSERLEMLVAAIIQDFPSPIAYFVFLASDYAETNERRLHFLKAAWEATIRLVHAICIAELRGTPNRITNQDGIAHKDLYTDKLALLIRNIGKISDYTRHNDVGGFSSEIGESVIEHMKCLNDVRNDLSHFQSVSEVQAGKLLQKAEPHFWQLMRELNRLAEFTVSRCLAVEGSTLRLEKFIGHSEIPKRQKHPVSPALLMDSYLHSPPLFNPENLLIEIDGRFHCLSPFLHYEIPPDGMKVQLYLLRQERVESGDKHFVYDVVGGENDQVISRQRFLDHMNSVRRLFDLEELD